MCSWATPLPRQEALVLMDLSSQSLWIEYFARLEKMAAFDYIELARRILSHLFINFIRVGACVSQCMHGGRRTTCGSH